MRNKESRKEYGREKKRKIDKGKVIKGRTK
jgi:hypothetical protein